MPAPTYTPIKTYPCRIEGDEVLVDIGDDHTNSSRAAIFGSERRQVHRGTKFMAAGFARPKMADHILVHMLRHRRGNHQVMAFRAE